MVFKIKENEAQRSNVLSRVTAFSLWEITQEKEC